MSKEKIVGEGEPDYYRKFLLSLDKAKHESRIISEAKSNCETISVNREKLKTLIEIAESGIEEQLNAFSDMREDIAFIQQFKDESGV